MKDFERFGINKENLKESPNNRDLEFLDKIYYLECPYYTYTDINDKVHTLIFESLEYAQEFEKNLENAIENFYDKYNDYVLNMN